MDLDSVAGRWITGSRRRGWLLICTAITAAFTLAIAAPASATPNTAKAWGLNNHGQLGDGTATGPEECGPSKKACSTTPVAVSGLSGVTAIAGGPSIENYFSLALLERGTVMDWGEGGKLGNGSFASSDVPVVACAVGPAAECPTGPYLEGVTAISVGEEHALALVETGTEKGAVVAWGSNAFAQLGNGKLESSIVPVAVCAAAATSPCSEASQQLKGAIAIAAGGEHSLALLSDHTVVAWGGGFFGELGDGTTKTSRVPVPVCAPAPEPCPGSTLSKVLAIAAGYRHSLALLEDGTVMAWGENTRGELGNTTESKSLVPVKVNGLEKVAAIAAGEHHSLALLKDATVKAWGSNAEGQLGTGTSAGPEVCGASGACSKTPVTVVAGPGPTGVLSGVSAVSAGGKHSLALLSNGTVKAWGLNGNGQLGDATSTGPEPCGPAVCSTTPVQVSGLSGTAGIGAGGEHSLAFGPPPAVTKLEPDAGLKAGGTSVTITGTDFIGVTAVKFGATNATSYTVNSASSITAESPAGVPGKVDVTVANGWGTSATSPADQFTYVSPGPPPAIRRMSPHKGPVAGGTLVTIKGTNFTGVTAVKFGSRSATSFTVNSARLITTVSPAGKKAKEKVAVTVTTPNGTSTSNIIGADRFKYV